MAETDDELMRSMEYNQEKVDAFTNAIREVLYGHTFKLSAAEYEVARKELDQVIRDVGIMRTWPKDQRPTATKAKAEMMSRR